MSTVAEKMDSLRKRSLHAVELAMYAALASQIEPELLRALRLEFVPDADAGCEADVWFSSLVQSAEPAGIVFSADAVSELRAAFLKEYAPKLKNAFKVIERVHANGPSALKVEEKLTHYALSDEADKQQKIQHELKTILAAMEDSSRSKHLARWAVRALPRLPDDAQKNSAASVLAVGASGLLNGRPIAAGASAQGTSDEWRVLTKILVQNIPYQNMYARLTRQGVEFSAEPFAGGQSISVPRTDPLQIQVEWAQDGSPVSKTITFAFNELGACETTANEITLRTILGDWYTLRLEKYDVFINFVAADQKWVDSVLVPPLLQAGLRVMTPRDFARGESLSGSFERAFKVSKHVVIVVSRGFRATERLDYMTEGSFVPPTDNPDNLPIALLREDVELPPRLKMLQAVDMRDPARFDSEMQRLLQALGVETVETTEQETAAPEQDTRAASGYLNFDLSILYVAGQRYIARADTPRGTAQNEFEMPFRAEEIENFWQNLVRPPRKSDTRENAAREFGGRLFEAVFAGQVRGFFFNSIASARNQNMGLRIRIDVQDAPELANLPWEFLYDASTKNFFGLATETPIVRFVNLPSPILPLRVAPPLRMLVLIAATNGSIPIDAQREWINLQHATQALVEQGKLIVERVEQATLQQLQLALRQNEYHIIHLIGQVYYDGDILLEDVGSKVNRVNRETLGKLFADHRSLRFVGLNTSQSLTDPAYEPKGNIARTLVRYGVSSAVNNEFPMSDAASVTLARELYSGLAENLPIDLALENARKAIFADGNEIEWASPVLYTRMPDGALFEIQAPPQVQPEEAEPVAEPSRTEPFGLSGRHINVTFEPPEQKDSPLEIGETYTLVVGIETEPLADLIAQSILENPLAYSINVEQVLLTVQFISDDFEIFTTAQKLIVPRAGKSRNRARFDISPNRNGVCELTAVLLHEGNTVQALTLKLNVGVGDTAVSGSESVGRPLEELSAIAPRALAMWIDYTGKEFRVNLLQASGTVSVTLRLSLEELDKIIADARRALDELVKFRVRNQSPYLEGIDIPTAVQRTALPHLAESGYRLFNAIFRDAVLNEQGLVAAKLLQEVMQGESAYIQIISREMVLPWNMLYVADQFDPNEIRPELFLGLKHIVEHIPLLQNMNFKKEIQAAPRLAVGLNLDRALDRQMNFPLVRNQETFWAQQARRNPITVIPRTNIAEIISSVVDPKTPDQIMYFFAIGGFRTTDQDGPRDLFLQFGEERITLEQLQTAESANAFQAASSQQNVPRENLFAGTPLVFINSCETALTSPRVNRSFLDYFVAKGARGMIGVEATVPALFAADYAQKFFDQFLAGKPLGQLMLDLRREYFFKHNNILGLLYGLYADADTRIVWEESEKQGAT